MDMISRTNLKREYVYCVQIIFVLCIIIASQNFQLENLLDRRNLIEIARYVIYLFIIRGTEAVIHTMHNVIQTHSLSKVQENLVKHRKSFLVFFIALGMLVYCEQRVRREEYVLLALASLVVKYPELSTPTGHISYGTGMACSFFEGYLMNVIPPDGTNFEGVQGAIRKFESANQKVTFPVRRLFLIITKSLHCPPDLQMLNRESRREDEPWLEVSKSLEDVQKDVAGVKARIYRNSTYKIMRRETRTKYKMPVYIAAECASPLHTLYKVKTRTQLYQELLNADFSAIRDDFCVMLKTILDNSPDCRNKVEFIFYDDEDKTQNLAAIILKKIEEIEPNFENLINMETDH